jgi:hypothetical protein
MPGFFNSLNHRIEQAVLFIQTIIHLSRLLHFVRNDGGSRTSLRGNAVTAAIRLLQIDL